VTAYLLRRAVTLLPLLLGLSIFCFTLGHLAPVDTARSLALLETGGSPPSQEHVDAIASEYGLDAPAVVQYGRWAADAVTGDLGRSLISGQPVTSALRRSFPVTLQLGLLAFLIVLGLGIPLGVAAALGYGRLPDHSLRLFTVAGASLPSYWLGYLLVIALSVRLNLFPTSGISSASSYVLPAITLALFATSVMVRITRAALLDVLGEEFIGRARASGVPERRIVVRHALRVALNPVATYGGLVLGGLLGGSVFVEWVFDMPGVGRLGVDAIQRNDLPVVQGFVLLTGTVVLVINLLIDLLYVALDPRVRLAGGDGPAVRAF
jgi:peptide/nickel transport system permease protein